MATKITKAQLLEENDELKESVRFQEVSLQICYRLILIFGLLGAISWLSLIYILTRGE